LACGIKKDFQANGLCFLKFISDRVKMEESCTFTIFLGEKWLLQSKNEILREFNFVEFWLRMTGLQQPFLRRQGDIMFG
jgi:hypothetical protein